MLPETLQFVIAMTACAINERMQHKLDHAQEEVRVLKDVLAAITGSGRILFTAEQRRRLAVAGKELSPEERRKYCQIVKPATLLAWFRELGARQYASPRRQVGRPRKARDIRKLVVEMALANLGWGYTKIRDALRTGLKIEIGRATVAERFVKTIKYECLNHFIFFGERHLRYVVKEFMAHYLAERFHQGIGGQLVKGRAGSASDNETNAAIVCRSRLGDFLNYYHREAA